MVILHNNDGERRPEHNEEQVIKPLREKGSEK